MNDRTAVARPQMSPYERGQLAHLRNWQKEPPGWGTRLLAKPAGGAAKVVQAVIPVGALRAAFKGVERAAHKLGGPQAILRRAAVKELHELREQPLQSCDRLAKFEERNSMMFAGASGAALGIAGAAGMAVDIPALIAQALRIIQRTGFCYGEDMREPSLQSLSLGIFALVSANSMEEKQAALAALHQHTDLLDAAWRDGVERAAERELAKEATAFSLQTLASRIGLNLGQRKAAGVVPVLGAVIGASVNAWYMHDVATTARYVFQERWLKNRYGRLAA